jgi:hypothetical protein
MRDELEYKKEQELLVAVGHVAASKYNLALLPRGARTQAWNGNSLSNVSRSAFM